MKPPEEIANLALGVSLAPPTYPRYVPDHNETPNAKSAIFSDVVFAY